MPNKSDNRGWHGDPKGHAEAGRKGGETTSQKYGKEFYEEIGKEGGQSSPTKFKKGDKRAKEAGRKGGQR
jgi:hypothetical protein